MGPPPNDDSSRYSSWLRFSHLGFQFALAISLGVVGGNWLDGRFGMTPWLTIAGSLLGISGGMYRVIVETNRIRS